MNVIKRDGRITPFDLSKIEHATKCAFEEVDKKITKESEVIAKNIAYEISLIDKDLMVEEIQDIVETKLMESERKDVAKAYILYREKRNINRNKNNSFIKAYQNRVQATSVENANANVDERSFSGREKEAASDASKYIALHMGKEGGGLKEEHAKAHLEMRVYEHDLEKAIYGEHNCLFARVSKLLNEGFSTRNGDVRPANALMTASQLIAVIFQCQSQVQYGGVGAMHVDTDLAPYVKTSFYKAYRTHVNRLWVPKFIKNNILSKYDKTTSIENYKKKGLCRFVYNYAMEDLEKEGNQSAQALFHNLNTLESRAGSQVPFSSLNYGRDTTFEGRLITKWLFHASLNGIGTKHLTSIFPISIFSYKQGVNANPEDPNYDLKRLALKSLSKRIYPNFANGDWSQAHEDPNNPDTIFATMGCRTLTGYDRHGLGYSREGRGNAQPVTIILPKAGIEYGICRGTREKADMEGFWKYLDESIQLAIDMLLERFELMVKQSPQAAPFMYDNGTIMDADKCIDNNFEALKHCTLAVGYIGLNELCYALFGCSFFEDEEILDFAIGLIKHMREKVDEASEKYNLNFSLYATPAEGLCSTSLESLKRQYGVIKNVTDRDYLTNSHHVPVWVKMSIFEKLKIESNFTKYPTGGCITYVELDSTFVNNLDAIEKIIDYAFKELDIPYLAFNFPINTCKKCGFQGEINETCPVCGSNQIQFLARVTGYLSTDVKNFNKGKYAEVFDRVKHSMYSSLDEILKFNPFNKK